MGAAGGPAPEPAPHRARRLLPRSLSARLVFGVVALVVVIVLGVGASTYFALRSFLYSRLDQQLQTTASSTDAIKALYSSDSQGLEPGVRTPEYVWTVALSPSGEVYAYPHSSSSVQRLELAANVRRALAGRKSNQPLTIFTREGEELRAEVRQLIIITPGGEVPSAIVIGLSTHEVKSTLRRLVAIELSIGAGAVVVALLATGWGVRFSLRRLHEVTDTAQEVAAELSPEGAGLDRRVAVDEEGTEVGRLADSMNTLLSAVETQFAARLESERRMRQFLADASHELRTPLTSIRGYAELARMQRAMGGQEQVADSLDRIESEGTRMSRLVEDLLTLARGDQGGAPETAPVYVDELLDDVVSSARAAFPARRIDLGPASHITVIGDQDQLLRAVRNLVTNAAAHTDPAGLIGVRAFASGPGIAIQVIDDGPGLPPEEAAHVFERFWRADKARTRARGGSGLGLAIVASIVAQHGGTVHFDSTVEHGSTVTIWLPGRIGSA